MKLSQKRFVVAPGSIHVAQKYEFKDWDNQSPFDNGYDIYAAAKELGSKVRRVCQKSDPQYPDWLVFKAHEELLVQHLAGNGKFTLPWGQYDILPSEDARFRELRGLRGGTDVIELHTKYALRMWEGNNDKTAKYKRFPGIRYGIALLNELNRSALSDNPFAQYELVLLEERLKEVSASLVKHDAAHQKKLDELIPKGLNIAVMKNPEPLEVVIPSMRKYAFQLSKLLLDYDMVVRKAKTLIFKGVVTGHDGGHEIYLLSRDLRGFLNDVYFAAMRMRSLQGVTRQSILSNEQLRKQLCGYVAENALYALPLEIWNYDRQPAFMEMRKKMRGADLQKLIDVVSGTELLFKE